MFQDQMEDRLKEYEKQMECQVQESATEIEELHKRNNEVLDLFSYR